MQKPLPQDATYAFHMHELNNRFGVAISSLTFLSKRLTDDLDKRLAETALMGLQHSHEYVKDLLTTPQK